MASDDRIIIPDDDVSIYSPTVPTMQDGAHGISLFANTPGDILVVRKARGYLLVISVG